MALLLLPLLSAQHNARRHTKQQQQQWGRTSTRQPQAADRRRGGGNGGNGAGGYKRPLPCRSSSSALGDAGAVVRPGHGDLPAGLRLSPLFPIWVTSVAGIWKGYSILAYQAGTRQKHRNIMCNSALFVPHHIIHDTAQRQ